MIDPRYAVYGVNGVAAIPLVEEHARTALRTIASRYSALPRSSLVSGSTLDEVAAARDIDTISNREQTVPLSDDDLKRSSPRVQFSSNEPLESISPLYSPFDDSDETTHLRVPTSSSSHSSLSDESTHSSEHSVSSSPVAKTLASRLSFWGRLSKRTPHTSTSQTEDDSALNPESHSLLAEQEVVDQIMDEEDGEPATMVNNILAATAPPPASAEEKQTELERKIIRECIKEYSKGGMYFAYNFGKSAVVIPLATQILRCLQTLRILCNINKIKWSSHSNIMRF